MLLEELQPTVKQSARSLKRSATVASTHLSVEHASSDIDALEDDTTYVHWFHGQQ